MKGGKGGKEAKERPPLQKLDERAELEQANVLYSLLEDRYMKKV